MDEENPVTLTVVVLLGAFHIYLHSNQAFW